MVGRTPRFGPMATDDGGNLFLASGVDRPNIVKVDTTAMKVRPIVADVNTLAVASDLAVEPDGNILFSSRDIDMGSIRRFDVATGNITAIAQNCTGSAVRLDVDREGNVFFSDTFNRSVGWMLPPVLSPLSLGTQSLQAWPHLFHVVHLLWLLQPRRPHLSQRLPPTYQRDKPIRVPVTAEGGIKCWGNGDFGRLGDGSLISNISTVSAGYSHTCALTTAGGVKCWGANYNGELGVDTEPVQTVPADVTGLTSGVTAVAAGSNHTCALTSVGAVKCWGSNEFGQLGDGTNTNSTAPVNVIGHTTGVVAISSGADHACAVSAGGP